MLKYPKAQKELKAKLKIQFMKEWFTVFVFVGQGEAYDKPSLWQINTSCRVLYGRSCQQKAETPKKSNNKTRSYVL